MNDSVQLSANELILLAAEDTEFFNRTFFPATFRQESAPMHFEVDKLLEGPERYVALKMFRGSAKTTRLRAFVAKRLSFGISRTVVFTGNAQKNAVHSLRWLRRQVERNTLWTQTFGIRPAQPWTDEHLCIYVDTLSLYANVIALGITSQIRGINLDDYRPDLIVCDDIDNEETTNTPEQREKTSDLMGSLEKALAPPTEAVNAKMAVLQTPINKFDYINTISQSTKWKTATFGCFDTQGRSRWEELYPTSFLLREKQEHFALRKMHLWMREMECKIVSKETSAFDVEWLRFWEKLPENMDVILAIDPASSAEKGADDQVLGAVGFKGNDVYLMDYTAEKGEMPEALAVNFFKYIRDYHPRKCGIETTAYQRVLKWYLEKQMREQRLFLVMEAIDDRRKKSDRIIQAISGLAAHGHLYVHKTHTKFIEQFADYSALSKIHDDVLDMVAIAIMSRRRGMGEIYEGEYDRIEEDEKHIPALPQWRAAV